MALAAPALEGLKSMTKHYDFFVIGAGSGGVRAARVAAQHGAKVGIAESAALGGTCVNLGCVPKKLLAYGADYGMGFEDAKGFGWSAGTIAHDWHRLIKNKNESIGNINKFYGKLLSDNNVDLYNGFATFVDPHTLDITGEKITAGKILIATGGKPRKLSVPGGELAWTSDDMFFLENFPRRLLIVGGGYIAVEFAHIMHGLGAHVDLAYRSSLFLRSFDDDIRLALAEEMKAQGIGVHFHCDIEKIETTQNGLKAYMNDERSFEVDGVLAAIGRDANTDRLNLEAAGVKTEKGGFLKVNDNYQTNVKHIYALGDIANKYNLTPVAIKEGHVLADQLFGNKPEAKVNYENIATAVFSHPPLATVGLSEEEARAKNYEVRIFKSAFTPMKHKLSGRNEKSVMKLVIDQKTDRVLGMHMMGGDAPEIIQGFAVALNAGATKADFDNTMAVHPTAAEEFVTMR